MLRWSWWHSVAQARVPASQPTRRSGIHSAAMASARPPLATPAKVHSKGRLKAKAGLCCASQAKVAHQRATPPRPPNQPQLRAMPN